jgi:hypothetical protein
MKYNRRHPTASAGVLAFERPTPEPLPACGNLQGTKPGKLNHWHSNFAIYLPFLSSIKANIQQKNWGDCSFRPSCLDRLKLIAMCYFPNPASLSTIIPV